MSAAVALENVALGVVTAKEARRLIQQVLQDLSHASVKSVYVAVRSWVWKALDSRRRDAELREWHRLIKATAGILRADYLEDALRLETLHELIAESISVSERFTAQRVVEKQHVKDVLYTIHHSPDARLSRKEIMQAVGLNQANLTRILNMMAMAALVRRLPCGKEAEFELTRLGIDWASRVPDAEVIDRVKQRFHRAGLDANFIEIIPRVQTAFSRTTDSLEVVRISSHSFLDQATLPWEGSNELRRQLRAIVPEPSNGPREYA